MDLETLTKTPIILIPAYEPDDSLIKTTTALRQESFPVVVVDDGSGPKFQEIFAQLAPEISLLHHQENLGKGSALKTGLDFIKKHFQNFIVITADADGQQQISDIKRMATTYRQHLHTILLGVRQFNSQKVPFRCRFGNNLTRKIYAFITKQDVSNTQTGLRAFDDSLIDFMLTIPGSRFEYEMNVLLSVSRAHLPIVELPIATIYLNNNQSSHFNPVKDSLNIYRQVLKFASSSLLSFALDLGIFSLLVYLTSSWSAALSVTVANITARLVSASFNFWVNRNLIFKDKNNLFQSALKYASLAALILTGNTLLLNFIIQLGLPTFWAKILTEIIFFSLSYLIQKHFIFNSHKEVTR